MDPRKRKAPQRQGFDSSLSTGQLVLPPGATCLVGGRTIATDEIDRLSAVTRDRDAAFTALFQRLAESGSAGAVTDARVLSLERGVILNRFGGSRAAYLAALARSKATVEMARAILADELRRADVAARLSVPAPTAGAIADYYATYANLPVRTVEASPAAPWLAGSRRGLAIASFAPTQVFSTPVGESHTFDALDGRFTIRPLDNPTPLGAIPLERIAPAITTALTGFARNDAYTRWSANLQSGALDRALCLGDRVPIAQGVDLTTYLPYLAVGGS